jgi:predicted RNase H-like HicB family nuclease
MSTQSEPKIELRVEKDSEYSFRVLLARDPADGGFTVAVPELPGVVSQGDTESEALNNIRDAFILAAQHYLESAGKIPWQKPDEEEEAGLRKAWAEEGIFDITSKWIQVDVG